MITTFRVGWLLAIRQIARSNIWTTLLVILIMALTFLNLVVVSGILVGLIEGAAQANRDKYTGDIFISTQNTESFIENSDQLLSTLESFPSVTSYTARYKAGATIEANYQNRRFTDELPDTAGTAVIGIDPRREDSVTGLSQSIIEGSYLTDQDDGAILLGANLLERNLENFGNTDFAGLADVFAGDKIRVTVGNNTREYTVKGIVDNKAGEVALRVYMLDREFRKLAERTDHNVNEIAVTISNRDQALAIKDQFIKSGLAEHAVVETWEEAQGQFLTDIKDTFGILGTVIGGIGLLVALITIFIIIFINALTRRKYIGILKGIGIPGASIEISYMIQSLFYAITGSLIGLFFIYVVLIPYFAENPIDFPFSDGILVAPIGSTMFRLIILIIATIIAGFIPARLIIKKNTLDSILGR